MEILSVISLLAELLVIVLAAALALNKKKTYGWLFAASFALFIVYDTVNFLETGIDQGLMEFMLLVGVVLSLAAVWQLYKGK